MTDPLAVQAHSASAPDALDFRDIFRNAARTKGLSAESIESRVKLSRPQLALFRDGDGPVVGQIGGKPSLPEGEYWPWTMAHVATIDLALLTRGSHDLDLPQAGHLVFLAEVEDSTDGGEHRAKVLYVPAGTPVTERELPQDSIYHEIINPMPLHGMLRWTLATTRYDTPFAPDGLDDDERDIEEAINNIVVDLDDGIIPPFAIGGYHGTIMSSDGDVISEPSKMTLLASAYFAADDSAVDPIPRLPSPAAEFWPVDILLEFVIAYEDLAARRFDKVELHLAWAG